MSPSLRVQISKLNEDAVIRLPFGLMNIMTPVEQMTVEAFGKNWGDLSKRPSTFQKLDVILKNPAPSHIPAA